MSKLSEAIFELLEAGADPNDLEKEFEIAVRNSGCDWALFGDGRWRKDTVCSICGSWVAGICGHENSFNREIISRSEYRKLHPAKGGEGNKEGYRTKPLFTVRNGFITRL